MGPDDVIDVDGTFDVTFEEPNPINHVLSFNHLLILAIICLIILIACLCYRFCCVNKKSNSEMELQTISGGRHHPVYRSIEAQTQTPPTIPFPPSYEESVRKPSTSSTLHDAQENPPPAYSAQ